MSRKPLFFLGSLLLFALAGCGYGFQNSRSPLSDQEGIRKIYLSPLVNNTYKAGVENIVYNALLRSLQAHRRVIVVRDKDSADAILQGAVQIASATGTTTVLASQLSPIGVLQSNVYPGNVSVYTEYNASLSCSFVLLRNGTIPRGKSATVWTSSFSRNKLFPANNQVGTAGNTNALINDSSLDRAISDIATAMMDDVNESMLAMF